MVMPLDGLRVLDLTRHMSGPYGTSFLADYGADIIKIESVPGGDPSRKTGSTYIGGESALFLMWNRGKRSVALDFRRPEALDAVKRIARDCDVFVENYRPGVAERIGLGYDDLAKENPGLIYIALSAFGRGPLEEAPGTDPVVQAMSGVMSVTGEADGGPVLVGIPIADFTGAMMVTQAVMLGLLARQKTGRGQKVELSMLYGLISGLTTRLARYWASGENPVRNGGAHSAVMPYQVFETSNGYVVAGVWGGANHLWPAFCEGVDHPELAEDPRYATNSDRLERREELAAKLQEIFGSRTTEEWETRFRQRSLLFGRVHTFSDVLEHPHVKQAGVVQQVQHPKAGEIPQLAPTIELSETPGRTPAPPPVYGQHTVEVLREAGYSEADVEALLAKGLAVSAGPETEGGQG